MLRLHSLRIADFVLWEQTESVVKECQSKTPKLRVWPHGEKLDTNHLVGTNSHQTQAPGTQRGWLS